MSSKLFQVNSFTNKAFKGNPAGVCILETEKSFDWMLNIAIEMNLSETAFILKKDNIFDLRWFTPEIEIDLCGHATLASAHILWENNYLDKTEKAVFNTKSGILTCIKNDNWIEMDFPSKEIYESEISNEILKSLNIDSYIFAGKNEIHLIEVENENKLKSIEPDFNLMKKYASKSVIVTSKCENKYDFVSRVFAPYAGINEDPVTGAAHCVLTPYWSKKLNKKELFAFQASNRGGELKLVFNGKRTSLIGKAVTIFEGYLKV